MTWALKQVSALWEAVDTETGLEDQEPNKIGEGVHGEGQTRQARRGVRPCRPWTTCCGPSGS